MIIIKKSVMEMNYAIVAVIVVAIETILVVNRVAETLVV